MAAIDKTYGTEDQSRQLWHWLKRHRPKYLRYHYGLYGYESLPSSEERPILNTPVSIDKWMARYCPFPFVLERICKVYNANHVAAKWAAKRLEGFGND